MNEDYKVLLEGMLSKLRGFFKEGELESLDGRNPNVASLINPRGNGQIKEIEFIAYIGWLYGSVELGKYLEIYDPGKDRSEQLTQAFGKVVIVRKSEDENRS